VDSPWLSVVVFAATLAYYPLAYWSLLGMETGLLAALLSAALLVAVRRDDAPRPSLALAVLLGLAMLTRPDAAVFVAIVAAYRATGLWRSVSGGRRGEAVRCLITEWLAVGAFVFGVSVFRFVYYGHLTPNTYLLKLGGFALRDRLPNGLGFIGPFLDSSAVFIVLALVMAVLDLSRLKLSIAGLVVAATAYQVWVGGDIGRCWRIMTPAERGHDVAPRRPPGFGDLGDRRHRHGRLLAHVPPLRRDPRLRRILRVPRLDRPEKRRRDRPHVPTCQILRSTDWRLLECGPAPSRKPRRGDQPLRLCVGQPDQPDGPKWPRDPHLFGF